MERRLPGPVRLGGEGGALVDQVGDDVGRAFLALLVFCDLGLEAAAAERGQHQGREAV